MLHFPIHIGFRIVAYYFFQVPSVFCRAGWLV